MISRVTSRRIGLLLSSKVLLVALALGHLASAQGMAPFEPEAELERTESTVAVTFQGFVNEPDGAPADGAVVISSAGGQAVTDLSGSFRLEARVPVEAESVQITAVGRAGRDLLASKLVPLPAATGPVWVGSMLLAQGSTCSPSWLPTFGGEPGTNDAVFALTVFDDGAGPALYAGGRFTTAGGVAANNVAKWDGSSWVALGTGMAGGGNSSVAALTVFDDGGGSALYAGGFFTSAGGVAANYIAKWDGSSWTALGSGLSTTVAALTVFDDGGGPALYAGGFFTSAGGMPASRIAKWNGSSWAALGTGMDADVRALTVFDDGGGPALYAGGSFTSAGGVAANYIAEWDGSSWAALGSGMDSTVFALTVFDGGGGPALCAGGGFSTAGGVAANRIAKWDGSSWAALGAPGFLIGAVSGLAFDPITSSLYGADASKAQLIRVDPLKGAGTPVGAIGFSKVQGLAFDSNANVLYGSDNSSDQLITIDTATGAGTPVGPLGFPRVWGLAYDPATNTLYGSKEGGQGIMGLITIDTTTGAGTLIGNFGFDGVRGLAFDPLTNTLYGSDVSTDQLITIDPGTGLGVAVGPLGFGNVSGLTFDSGTNTLDGAGTDTDQLITIDPATGAGTPIGPFSTLGGGMTGSVWSLTVFDDGGGPALYAGGQFMTAGGMAANRIAKWNGSTWAALGSGTSTGTLALTAFDDGGGPALYAGGQFSSAIDSGDSYLAKWGCSSPSSGTVYCTAGTSAVGCQALISANGTPSASAATGFTLVAAGVEGQKDGLYYFGVNGRQANAWGSGSSFQCVQFPVSRGGLLLGSGTVGACDGSFSQDLNARWQAKPNQNPGAGAVVQAQLWYRDPFNTSNQTTSLSDAIEFVVAP